MKRFDYIDVTKGIGILLVVWAHMLLVGWTHRLIYAFHMPLFFFVSGMLFKRDKYDSFVKFIKARAKRLLVPYVLYSVVTWAIWVVFRYVTHSEVKSYWMPLLQTVIAQGSGEFMVHNSALWFIPCLFAVEMMYFFIAKINDEALRILACLLIAGAGVELAHLFGGAYLFLLPWNLDAAFYALLFYGVANVLMGHVSHADVMSFVEKNRGVVFVANVVMLSVLWFLSMNFGECSMGSSSYGCAEYIFFMRAFVGIAWLLTLCALFCSSKHESVFRKALCWCGTNSLDIMCTHIPIKGVVMIAVGVVFSLSCDISADTFWSMASFAVTMVICTVVTMAVNRFIRQ